MRGEPLGQLLGGSLAPFVVLLLPGGLEVFGSDNFPATLIHFLSVIVRPGVGSPLVLGIHADLGRVLSSEGLRVKTLLQGLGSELSLLSLLQFLQVELLGELSLFIVILVSLHLDDGLEELLSLGLELTGVHLLKGKRLDSDAQSDLLLLLKLLLGLGEFLAGIISRSTSNRLLLIGSISLLSLLGLQHLPSLSLSLLKLFLLLLSLLGLPVSLLLPQLVFLFLLLGIEFLLLLSPDLLPLGLLLLQLGQLLLLGLPGLPPFCDVLLQRVVQLCLLCCLVVSHYVCVAGTLGGLLT